MTKHSISDICCILILTLGLVGIAGIIVFAVREAKITTLEKRLEKVTNEYNSLLSENIELKEKYLAKLKEVVE